MNDGLKFYINTIIEDVSSALTVESFGAAIQAIKDQPYRHVPLVLPSHLQDELDKIQRTKTIKRIGNYELDELDGRRWWGRAVKMYDGEASHPFPRDVGEGWTSWWTFNRCQRKHGFPAQTSDWREVVRLIPSLARR